jgi:RNA polymerase sigma factor (sigma-70 family)
MDFVQQRELVVRYQAGDRRAGDLLLLGVEKYIQLIAKRYSRRWSPDFEDVLQAGREGFLKGVLRFDGREVHLLTYASHWIKHSIRRFIVNEGAVVRFPVHQYDEYTDHTGVVRPRRRNLRQRSVFTFSEMANAQQDSERYAFEETLIDQAPLAEETLTDAELEYWIPQVTAHWMTHLEPRERDVLLRRFANPEEMLVDIGRIYGVTRERIRQVEAIALNRLRHRLGLNHIKPGAKKISFKTWVSGLVTTMLDEQEAARQAERITAEQAAAVAAKALKDAADIARANAVVTARLTPMRRRSRGLLPLPPVQPQWPTAAPLRRWKTTR